MYIYLIKHKAQFDDFCIFVSIITINGRECYFGR